jgi:hypothetical protein
MTGQSDVESLFADFTWYDGYVFAWASNVLFVSPTEEAAKLMGVDPSAFYHFPQHTWSSGVRETLQQRRIQSMPVKFFALIVGDDIFYMVVKLPGEQFSLAEKVC